MHKTDADGKTMRTVYITTGYRWGQNAKTITVYLLIPGANELDGSDYTLDVQPRSIYMGINNHRGVNYNFKIGKLCGQLEPQGTKIKFREDQVIIYLQKKEYGKHWNDIKEKSIHEVYSQMERKLGCDDGQAISKDSNNGLVNDFDKQPLGNSDPSTWHTAAELLSNQQARQSDFGYSLDPFHIADTIPSTSSSCPNSHEKNC